MNGEKVLLLRNAGLQLEESPVKIAALGFLLLIY
jgi:hypothetical protein